MMEWHESGFCYSACLSCCQCWLSLCRDRAITTLPLDNLPSTRQPICARLLQGIWTKIAIACNAVHVTLQE
jgi:hypothetical protein